MLLKTQFIDSTAAVIVWFHSCKISILCATKNSFLGCGLSGYAGSSYIHRMFSLGTIERAFN